MTKRSSFYDINCSQNWTGFDDYLLKFSNRIRESDDRTSHAIAEVFVGQYRCTDEDAEVYSTVEGEEADCSAVDSARAVLQSTLR